MIEVKKFKIIEVLEKPYSKVELEFSIGNQTFIMDFIAFGNEQMAIIDYTKKKVGKFFADKVFENYDELKNIG